MDYSKEPLVSILIPVYNRENIIAETINSAMAQSYKKIEIIVVDNCSRDNTFSVVEKMAEADSRIRVFQNKKNVGPVNNWQICLKHAKGKYVKILWSDDLMENTFIEKAVGILEKDNDIAFVYSKVIIFKEKKEGKKTVTYAFGKSGKYSKNEFFESLFSYNRKVPVSPGCAFFRKKDVHIKKEIKNTLGVDCNKNGAGIDCLIYLMATRNYTSFYYLDEALNLFRAHKGSFSCTENLIKEYTVGKLYFARRDEEARKYIDKIYFETIFIEANMNFFKGYTLLKEYGFEKSVFKFIYLYISALMEKYK